MSLCITNIKRKAGQSATKKLMISHQIFLPCVALAGLLISCHSLAEESATSRKQAANSFNYFRGIEPYILGSPLASYDRTHWKHIQGPFEHMYVPNDFPKTLGQGKIDSVVVGFVDQRLALLEIEFAGAKNIDAAQNHLSLSLGKPVVRGNGPLQDTVWEKGASEIILRRHTPNKASLMWLLEHSPSKRL